MFRKEVFIMKLEEFNELLKKNGFSKEFNLKWDQIVRAVNDQGNRLEILEAKVANLKKN